MNKPVRDGGLPKILRRLSPPIGPVKRGQGAADGLSERFGCWNEWYRGPDLNRHGVATVRF